MADEFAPITRVEVVRTLWSKLWSKEFWLAIAEIIDAWRIFPRTFVGGYGAMCLELVHWAIANPDQATKLQWLIGLVVGALTPILAFYFNSGRSWTK